MNRFFLLSLIFIFLLSCDNNSSEPLSSGMGSFTLRLSSPARTITPAAIISLDDIKEFELIFTSAGSLAGGSGASDDFHFNITEFSGSQLPAIFLDPGTYSLTVNAYNSIISSDSMKAASLIARGTLSGIIIKEGEYTNATVTLRPLLFEEGTTGIFSYNITVPNDVITIGSEAARMIIEPLDVSTGTLAQTIPFNFSGTVYNAVGSIPLNSGTYNVSFHFERAAHRLVWRELLHIYSTLESSYSRNFSEEDFYSLYHTITFEYNNGNNPGVENLYHGAKITKPVTDPQRTGYGFAGWYTDDGFFLNEWDFDTLVIHDVTLYAKWLPENHFDVDYDPANDKGPKLAIDGVPVTQDTEIVIWRDVTDGRENVTLTVTNAGEYNTGNIEWFYGTTLIGTGNELTLDSSNPTYNILGLRVLTVTAEIDGLPYSTRVLFTVLKQFTVTFYPNNGELPKVINQNYGEEIDENETSGFTPDAVTRTAGLYLDNAPGVPDDYALDGWYLGETKWNFATNVVQGDITLTARWKPSNMVDLTNTSGTTLLDKAFTYVNNSTNAFRGSYTLYLDNTTPVNVTRTLNGNNARLTIRGLGGIERVITYSGTAGTSSSLISISGTTSSLTIGENITLKGSINTVAASLVNVSSGTFTMLDGSKITGLTTSSASGAVYIGGGTFNLEGGEITGNKYTSTATAATGGVTVAGGTFNMAGGAVTGNFRNNDIAADVYVTSTTAGAFKLSGNAKLGVLMLNATGTTDTARSTVTLDNNWTGNAILHLRGDSAVMNTVISYWVNKPVIRDATTDGIASLALGNFVSSATSNNTQQIGNVYNIVSDNSNVGNLRLNKAQTPDITTQPQNGTYITGGSHGSQIPPLTVVVTNPTDGGVLSYQWYSYTTDINNATEVTGEIDKTFTPPATEGTFYYYVAVTNTVKNALNQNLTASVNSSVASITVRANNDVAVYLNNVPYLSLETALDTITAAGNYVFKMVRNQTIAPRNFTSSIIRNITFIIDDAPVDNPVEIQLSGNGSLFTINSSNTFNLENGITLKGHDSNTAPLIYVNSGTFNMKEGSKITGNKNTTATSYGGGVYTTGAFNMSGGEISGNSVVGVSSNHGGGVYFASGTLNIGGTAKIINNKKETGDISVANNVYLSTSSARIAIGTGTTVPIPASGMKIGVSVPGFTSTTVNTLFANNASAGYEQYFFADVNGLDVEHSSTNTTNLAIVKRTPFASEKLVGIYMNSGYDYTWNNARLRIFINGIEVNEIVSINTNSYTNYYYLLVESGATVTFFWTKGSPNYDSYYSFAVYYDEDPPATFPSSNSYWYDSKALVYKLYGTSNGTTEGAFLGMFP